MALDALTRLTNQLNKLRDKPDSVEALRLLAWLASGGLDELKPNLVQFLHTMASEGKVSSILPQRKTYPVRWVDRDKYPEVKFDDKTIAVPVDATILDVKRILGKLIQLPPDIIHLTIFEGIHDRVPSDLTSFADFATPRPHFDGIPTILFSCFGDPRIKITNPKGELLTIEAHSQTKLSDVKHEIRSRFSLEDTVPVTVFCNGQEWIDDEMLVWPQLVAHDWPFLLTSATYKW